MAKKREEFSNEYKWNTKDLYVSDEEALKDLDKLDKEIKEFKGYEKHILDSNITLLNLLKLDSKVSQNIEKLYIYAHINHDADTNNVKYQELFGKVQNLYTKYLENTSFIVPELLKKDYKLIEKYIKENKELEEYNLVLKNIYRNKKHVLSKKEEKILSSYAKVFSLPDAIMSSLTDSDLVLPKIKVGKEKLELTESNYSLYIRDNNRDIRKQAFTNLHETYGNFKNTLARTLRGEVEKNVISASLRGFKNSLNASLYHSEIDTNVYHNLIKGVHNNLDVLYKYWDLKKKILNLDELHIYDTYTTIDAKNNKKYSYEEAENLILEVVKPLGDTYVTDLKKAFNDKWIDSCNNEGKRGGAYCTCAYNAHPYVLLSYEGALDDVSTLAHELGHAMHYYYALSNQKYQDYGYSIFVAEVASQVNEILMSRYLLDHTNEKSEKIKIIDDLLQKYKSTIFRQTMFAEFELFMHEYVENGGILTYQNMCDKYYELNKLYYGNNVVVDDLIKYEWERIPHFYMNFYVYQYAIGFAAAIKLANKIYEGDKVTRDKYLEFLKLGSTKNPIDSLLVAGVDMKDVQVLDDAINFMSDLIKEYELLIGSEENE